MLTLEFGFVCNRHDCVLRRAATRISSEMLVLTSVARCRIWLRMVDGRNDEDLAPSSSNVTNLKEAITIIYASWTQSGHKTYLGKNLGLHILPHTLQIPNCMKTKFQPRSFTAWRIA